MATRKKRHVWVTRTRRLPGERKPDFCQACGIDRSPKAEAEGCRPTIDVFREFGF